MCVLYPRDIVLSEVFGPQEGYDQLPQAFRPEAAVVSLRDCSLQVSSILFCPETSKHEIQASLSAPLSAAVHPAVFCFVRPKPACLVVLNISCEPSQVSQAAAGLCPESSLDRPCLS